MLTVFLCHAPADARTARELAAFLERGAHVRVFVEEGAIRPGEDIVDRAAEGLIADVILLMFSPASVPARWSRARWEPAFCFGPAAEGVRVAAVECGECVFPLQIKPHFDLRTPLEGMRNIKRWLIELGAQGGRIRRLPPGTAPCPGRERELEILRAAIADRPGAVSLVSTEPGAGKTSLAREFARLCADDFEDAVWVWCAARRLPEIAGHLAAALGFPGGADPQTALGSLRAECSRRRLLVVFDGLDDPAGLQLIPSGHASALVTSDEAGMLRDAPGSKLDFRALPGFDAHVRAELPSLSREESALLQAAATCAPAGLHIEAMAAAAGLAEGQAEHLARALAARGLLTPESETFYTVHECVRRAAGPAGDAARNAVARALCAGGPPDPAALPGLRRIFEWAVSQPGSGAWELACRLAKSAVGSLDRADRAWERFEWLCALSGAAGTADDANTLEWCRSKQYWILMSWGWEGQAEGIRKASRALMPHHQPSLFEPEYNHREISERGDQR